MKNKSLIASFLIIILVVLIACQQTGSQTSGGGNANDKMDASQNVAINNPSGDITKDLSEVNNVEDDINVDDTSNDTDPALLEIDSI